MQSLVEVHDETELEQALEADAELIGINNRDLHTFKTSLDITTALRPHTPEGVILVSESGIHTLEDTQRLAALNVDAMLIGEELVTAVDTAARVREFTRMANKQRMRKITSVNTHSPPASR